MTHEEMEIMRAHTEALKANTAALLEQTTALHDSAEATKKLHRLLSCLTEDPKNGGHIGASEALAKAQRIVNDLKESARAIDNTSKRIADASSSRRY